MLNLGDKLYYKLPNVYRQEDAHLGYPLKRFLQILGAGLDDLEGNILDYININDIDKCPAPLLPVVAQLYGLEFPYDMDEVSQRKFIKILPKLYLNKGRSDSFAYLAREVFQGDGKVTSVIGNKKPDDMTIEDWLSSGEWAKYFVGVEVNGETTFLEDKTQNFIKFCEMLRPINTKILPHIKLFYRDDYKSRDNLTINEDLPMLIATFDNDQQDFVTKTIEDNLVPIVSTIDEFVVGMATDESNPLFLTKGLLSSVNYRLNNVLPLDYIKYLPEEDIRSNIMYEHSVSEGLKPGIDTETKNLATYTNIDTSKHTDADNFEVEVITEELDTPVTVDVDGLNNSNFSDIDISIHLSSDILSSTKDFAVSTTYSSASTNMVVRQSTNLNIAKLTTGIITTNYAPKDLILPY